MRFGTAGSGLRWAVRKGGNAVGWCALSIRCGTRDEEGFSEGIAHFTEHTLFRGCKGKSASAINNCLDRLGGDLNAFTTKEEIVLHATVLKEDIGKAVRLLLSLATSPTFPEKELETERGVVADEIISYKDSPADEIYDRFEEMLFSGHPLGRRILGTESSVRKITREDLVRFTGENFTPGRMALTIVAPLEEDRMEKDLLHWAGAFFPDGHPSLTVPDAVSESARPILPSSMKRPEPVPFDTSVRKRNHEVNAIIGTTAPSLYDEKERIATILLCNILGGPASNSLLNERLREKKGWVYGIECTYTQYADTGIVTIAFGCDKPNLEPCFREIDRILEGLRENLMDERKLAAARKQLIGQLAVGAESGETQALSMGKAMLAFGRVSSPGEDRARIEAVTAEDLRALASRLLSPSRLSRLIYC